MKAIIIQVENHPDRCIEDVIGPYDSWDEAHEAASKMEEDAFNINNHGSRKSQFHTHYLTTPEDA